MNEFVSWCRHLLVSFLFHALTSLHPPSFHRNDFSTCSTHFSFILVQSQDVFFAQCARRLYARACARGEPTVHAHVNGGNDNQGTVSVLWCLDPSHIMYMLNIHRHISWYISDTYSYIPA